MKEKQTLLRENDRLIIGQYAGIQLGENAPFPLQSRFDMPVAMGDLGPRMVKPVRLPKKGIL